jgi:hypothetical protein
MDAWIERLRVAIGVAELYAADASTPKEIDDGRAALAPIERALGEKGATVPSAGGAAGATWQLCLLIGECVASGRDEATRERLRSALAVTKDRWSRALAGS